MYNKKKDHGGVEHARGPEEKKSGDSLETEAKPEHRLFSFMQIGGGDALSMNEGSQGWAAPLAIPEENDASRDIFYHESYQEFTSIA
ncbi:hypothetical protein HY625_01550 [Candidatus Uhrbacteria bacterium]|nr:hypothetical protein [Candidatus Uhrbacteria bacterium]